MLRWIVSAAPVFIFGVLVFSLVTNSGGSFLSFGVESSKKIPSVLLSGKAVQQAYWKYPLCAMDSMFSAFSGYFQIKLQPFSNWYHGRTWIPGFQEIFLERKWSVLGFHVQFRWGGLPKHQLGGGNSSNFLIFTRIFGEMIQSNLTTAPIFSDGLVRSTSNQSILRFSTEISAPAPWFTIDLRLDMAPTRQMWEQNYGALMVCWATNSLEVEGVSWNT